MRLCLLLVAGLLAACGGAAPGVTTDEFTPDVIVNGPWGRAAEFFGPEAEWRLQSFVGKAEPHAVSHRVLATITTRSPFAKYDLAHDNIRFRFAADDTATELEIVPIAAQKCGFGEGGCPKDQTIGVVVPDAALRAHAVSGYRIKISAPQGSSEILTLPPEMLKQQLAQVDNLVQGEAPKPAPGTPRLGLAVIAATSAPFAGEPGGVIVVETAPNSPAAQGGVRPGDLLVAIDAQKLRVSGDLARIAAGLSPGRAVTLELRRAGQPITATVQL